MYHFFVTPEQVREDTIYIVGPDVNHMKNVLRMKVGEQVQISDGNNQTYHCKIEKIESEQVQLCVLERQQGDTELSSRVYLFQGLPKNDKMEYIIQKAVELGVYEIIPVATKRTVVKLDDKKAIKKVERWNSIAQGGAKQSGRNIIPTVISVMSYREALQYASTLDVVLIPYELAKDMNETRRIIDHIIPGQSVGIFIGPEGGFAVEEVNLALEIGAKPITLGRRILRTETAGLTTLSILMYHLES
ncbi:MAG: 16S rRNA (uracil(1498)-N(3))-methyltransferase [Lachnospiraceae bacterium]